MSRRKKRSNAEPESPAAAEPSESPTRGPGRAHRAFLITMILLLAAWIAFLLGMAFFA